ncbi:MAG: T9SS type A sorting domain-containing protein [Bacteroidota bacterium]
MKPFCLAILSLWVSINYVSAQSIIRNFTTLQYNKTLQAQDVSLTGNSSNVYQRISAIEQQTAEYVRYRSQFTEKTIPVVFHILHAEDVQKISAERIHTQLDALNAAFALANPIENHPNDPQGIYAKRAVDTKIRFCLATEDADGNPISGIQYVPTSVKEWTATEGIKQRENGAEAITPDGLLNIWVAALPTDHAGYAQMPERGSSTTDGIVMNYRYVGNTNDQKFGLTSLVFCIGQYLNLYPLSGHSLDIPCSDDFVDDTPISNSRNSGCPSGNHISLCEYKNGKFVNEQSMNIMSANTDDNCKYLFTLGQAARMHAVLDSTGARSGLALTPTTCTNELSNTTTKDRKQPPKTTSSTDIRLTIFPNPATDRITLQSEATDISKIELWTSEGKIVLSQSLKNDQVPLRETLNISYVPAGFYVIKVQTTGGILVEKLTIER